MHNFIKLCKLDRRKGELSTAFNNLPFDINYCPLLLLEHQRNLPCQGEKRFWKDQTCNPCRPSREHETEPTTVILRVNLTNFREMVACRAKVFLTKASLKSDSLRPPFWKQMKKRRIRKRGTGEEGKIKPVVVHPGIIFWLVATLCLSHHSRSLQTIRRII